LNNFFSTPIATGETSRQRLFVFKGNREFVNKDFFPLHNRRFDN
jgi:hypothetical protein